MSVERTNRIIDLHKKRKDAININIELNNIYKKPKLFTKNEGTSICSQCKHLMSKHMADQQIANKRENAPICMACIMEKPRKEKGTSKWSNIHKLRNAIKSGEKYTKEKDTQHSRKAEINKLFDR